MRNNYAALESGWIPGNIRAFTPNAVGKIQYYEAVVEFVEDVGDAIGDAVETIGDVAEDIVDSVVDVVEDVGKTLEKTVQAALDDPLKTIATIAAVATGQAYLIPYINAGATLARGGSFEDALKSYVVSTVAQGVGSYVGDQLGTALEYGTDLGSAQTAMLAQQSGDMIGNTLGGTIGSAVGAGAAGATAAALTGGDVEDAFLNALANYGVRAGVNYTLDQAGRIVDQMGRPAPEEAVQAINADTAQSLGGNTVTYDDGSSITYDAAGNPVSATATDGTNIFFNPQTPEDYLSSKQPITGDVDSGEPVETPGADVTEAPIEGETTSGLPVETPEADVTETPLGEMPGVVTNPDGTMTQTFDDGSTITFDANGNPISASDIDGNAVDMPLGGGGGDLLTPGEDVVGQPTEDVGDQEPTGEQAPGEDAVGEPSEDVGDQAPTPESQLGPTMTRNPDGSITQKFDDGSSITYDDNGNVLGTTDATDLGAGSGSNLNWGAVGRYGRNMLSNQLSGSIMRQIMGQPELKRTTRVPTSGPGRYGVTGANPEDIASEMFSFASKPEEDEGVSNFNLDQFENAPPVAKGLFNPLEGASWAPQQKLSGLGFAGKFINPQTDSSTYFTNKNQAAINAVKQKEQQGGWLTEEERQMLDASEIDASNASLDPNAFSVQFAAQGGLIGHNPSFYSEGGASLANRYVKGDGDGTSDSIPAMLATGEFVIPADVVSSLGNGDNDAGAKELDKFMSAIRQHKRKAGPKDLPPDSMGALQYLAMATKKKKVG